MTAPDATAMRTLSAEKPASPLDPIDATSRLDRVTAIVGLVGVLAAAVLCGWLDLAAGDDTHRNTISGYVFSHPITFTTAVIALILGSSAVLYGFISRGIASWRHPGTWLMSAWIVGMLLVAIFPKHDWSVGPSFSGHVHRVGSLVAFIALPLAVVLLTRGAIRRGMGAWAYAALTFALASYAYLGYLAVVITTAGRDGVAWWRAVPLGLSERILLVLEVAALAMLACGLLRRSRPAPR